MAEIDPMRRRLTVSIGDAPPGHGARGSEKPEVRAELIISLGLTKLFAEAEEAGKKAGCVVSITDRERERKKPYGQKDETVICVPQAATAEVLDWMKSPGGHAMGWACKKGFKTPAVCNQDSMSALVIEDTLALYGVYDGHGPHGHDVSEFVCRTLPRLFFEELEKQATAGQERNVEQAFHACFTDCQALIEEKLAKVAQMSGTTCTMAFHDLKTNQCWMAHVGDSRSILGTADGKQAVGLTEDHKPNLPAEKARIEKSGGRVIFDGYFNHRVFAKDGMYPGLNMSRAMGDIIGHKEAGLSAVPELLMLDFSSPEGCQGIQANADKVLVLCTDGVWEFIENDAAVKLVCTGDQTSEQAIEDLVKMGYDSWMKDSENEISDDITGIMVRLRGV